MGKVEKKEPSKVGAPTKYKQEYANLAYNYCLLGATDVELADFFDVEEKTINNWKSSYPEFLQSIKRGKGAADGEVANKLFQRATGYEAPDVDIKVIDGQIVITPLVKHHPPDTAAMIFWLKNRQKGKWRDKIETGVTDKNGDDVLAGMTEAQIDARIKSLSKK